MEDARARYRSAQKALFRWRSLVERQGFLMRAFTAGEMPLQHQHDPLGVRGPRQRHSVHLPLPS